MKKSYYQQKTKLPKYPTIDQNQEVDILIIGGGLTGLQCAYDLKSLPYSIMLVERDGIMSHSSGHMTGKLSYFHPKTMATLLKNFGEKTALLYFKANIEAYKKILEMIKEEHIDCDLQINTHYFYSIHEVDRLRQVYELLKDKKHIHYMNNQISLYPLATYDSVLFSKGLLQCLKNVKIYEHSLATFHKKQDGYHYVEVNGYWIKAKYLIVASRYPVFQREGLYFLKLQQTRLPLYMTSLIDRRIVLLEDKQVYSRKNVDGYNLHVSEDELRLGQEIMMSWYNQDTYSHDGLPLIGYYTKKDSTYFVATGFNKWGSTLSKVSILLIKDLIEEKDNHYQELFDPHRITLKASFPSFMKLTGKTLKGEIYDRLFLDTNKKSLADEEGTICTLNDQMIAVYKESGHYYGYVPVCTHLGCILHYNEKEHTFVCPCHGSIFNAHGQVEEGPALYDLEKVKRKEV